MVGKMMLTLVTSVIMRLLYLLGMLMLNPITCAFMPIDGGASMTTWRKQFIVNFVSLYIIIFTFNIFYLIYPIAQTITLFPENGTYAATATLGTMATGTALGTSTLMATNVAHGFVDYIFQLFFLIAGLQTISKMTELFERILGRDDKSSLMGQAGDVTKAVLDEGKKVAQGTMKVATGVGKVALGAAGLAAGAAVGTVGKVGQLAGNIGDRIGKAKQQKNINRHATAANVKNRDIRNSARQNTKNSQEYARVHASRTDQAYKDYQNSGGKLSRDQWDGGARGAGSAYAAGQNWNNMTAAEKAAGGYDGKGGWMKYMRDQHNSTGADPKEFNDWLKTRTNVMEDERLGRETSAQASARITTEMDAEIDSALAQGVGTTDIGRAAVNEYNTGVHERDQAAQEVARSEAMINQHNQNIRYRNDGGGASGRWRRAGSGIARTTFRMATSSGRRRQQ